MPVFALAVEGRNERLVHKPYAPIELQRPAVFGGYRQHKTQAARLPDLLGQTQQERPTQTAT
jgi:hypothetical protein